MTDQYFIYLIESSICFLAFGILFFLLFRNEKYFNFNRIYLLLTPVLSMLIPLLQWEIQSDNFTESPLFYIPNNAQQGVETFVINQTTTYATDHWTYLIPLIFLLGASLVLLRLVIRIASFRRFKKANAVIKGKAYDLIYSNQHQLSFSFLNTIVLPSSTMTNHDLILKHEQAHIQHRHSWDILFFEMLQALAWFHPMIYCYKIWIKEQHEFVADADAIKANQSIHFYASALVSQYTGDTKYLVPFANHFNSITIKKRLKMMAKKESNYLAKAKTTLSLPLLMVLLICFGTNLTLNAQKAKNYQAGKIYTSVKLNTKEAQEARIKEIIADGKTRGKEIKREDIVFIGVNEFNQITNPSTSAIQDQKSWIKWGGGQSKNSKTIQADVSQTMEFFVDDKKQDLLSNVIVLEQVIEKKGATVTLLMQKGKLDKALAQQSGIDFQKPIKVKLFDFVVKGKNGEQKLNTQLEFQLLR